LCEKSGEKEKKSQGIQCRTITGIGNSKKGKNEKLKWKTERERLEHNPRVTGEDARIYNGGKITNFALSETGGKNESADMRKRNWVGEKNMEKLTVKRED